MTQRAVRKNQEEWDARCPCCKKVVLPDSLFCQFCGTKLEYLTEKKNPPAGKNRSGKTKWIVGITVVILLAYLATVCGAAVVLFYSGDFAHAYKCMDAVPFGRTVFGETYKRTEAEIQKENGDYLTALASFSELERVSDHTMNELLAEMYTAGQTAYKMRNFDKAKDYFAALGDYDRCKDYLLLIQCWKNAYSAYTSYDVLLEMLDFEDTADLLLSRADTAEKFLQGRWETHWPVEEYFWEMSTREVNYNLPSPATGGYVFISDSRYAEGETEETAVECFVFTALNKNTIRVFCRENNMSYILYRQ